MNDNCHPDCVPKERLGPAKTVVRVSVFKKSGNIKCVTQDFYEKSEYMSYMHQMRLDPTTARIEHWELTGVWEP